MKDQCYEFLKNEVGKVQIVGFGSYGEVKLAKNSQNNEIVAIKMIYNKNAKQQIDVHHKLNHPSIIKLINYYYEKDKNTTYMVLQYASGGTLNQKIKFGYGQLSKNMIKSYFKDICGAVQYLHQNNYMHRDIKTENILITKDNHAKLCDFGFASILEYRSTLCGTFQYMAPEMIQKKPYDYKIDIWALGILLFQLIQGYAPFRGETGEEVITEMKKALIFSSRFDQVQIDLIKKILRVNAENRLQISKILDHAYFKSTHEDDQSSIQTGQTNIKTIKITKDIKDIKQPKDEFNDLKQPKEGLKDIKQLKEGLTVKQFKPFKFEATTQIKKKEGQKKFDFLGKKKEEKKKEEEKGIKIQVVPLKEGVKQEVKKEQKGKEQPKKQFKPYIPPNIQHQRNGIKSPLMRTPVPPAGYITSTTNNVPQTMHQVNHSMQTYTQPHSFPTQTNPNSTFNHTTNKQFLNNSYTQNQPIPNQYNPVNFVKNAPQNFYIQQRAPNHQPINSNPQMTSFNQTTNSIPWKKP